MKTESIPSPEAMGMKLVVDSTVPGIGDEELICLYPEKVKGIYSGRWHEQHTVELDGHRHSVLVTDSSSKYSETDLYFFPGFTQTTDEPGGIGFKLHTELARRRPNDRIISVASTGIGRFGDRIIDPRMATVDAMGEQRLRLAESISHDRRVKLIGLSMGSVVKNRLLQEALRNNSDVEIAGVVNYVSALVLPSRVNIDMLAKFPVHIAPDALREFFDKRNLFDPRKLVATLRAAGRLGLCGADFKPMRIQGLSLKDGTPREMIRNETDYFRVGVINGERDSLCQAPMWSEEEGLHPETTSFTLVRGRGHGMAVDSVGAAAHIDRKLDQIDPAA